jgi:enediyne biosynthesis protein E4
MNRRMFLDGMVGAGVALASKRIAWGQEPAKTASFPVKFQNVAAHAGLTAPTIFGGRTTWKYILETTGCGAAFFDYDNDSWPDVFWVNGHVYPELEQVKGPTSFRMPMVLYHNLGNGKFEDAGGQAGPAFQQKLVGRGAAFGDFDNDGMVDILVNPINDLPILLKCESTSGNNWITLKLIGTKSNRSAIGTRVRCVTGKHSQIDEVRSGDSFMSQSDLRVHFGLGKAPQIDLLEVSWPSGRIDQFNNLAVNKIITLREGGKL